MAKNWFEQKEVGAGEKRLILTYYLYKIFGSYVLRIIAFFVVLSVFLFSKERREASKKFFEVLNKKNYLLNSFKLFLNYGNALVDKFLAFTGDLKYDEIILDNPDIYKGAFFITSHIGNIEILRAFLEKEGTNRANIFLQSNACEIFNKFLKKFEKKTNLEVFPVEEIDIDTSFVISERIKNGEIVFMAGDRVSAQNSSKTYSADFLGQKINLPLGTLRFALALNATIYFIVCINGARERKKYFVCSKKFESKNSKRSEKLEDLKQSYSKFLEECTLNYPLQFYNFFDIFQS